MKLCFWCSAFPKLWICTLSFPNYMHSFLFCQHTAPVEKNSPAPTLSVSQCLTRAHIFSVSMSQCPWDNTFSVPVTWCPGFRLSVSLCPGTTLSVSQWHGVQGSDFQCFCVLGPHFQWPSDMVCRVQTFSVPVSWDHSFSVQWHGVQGPDFQCPSVLGPHFQCPSDMVSRVQTFSIPVFWCPGPTHSMSQCLGVPGPHIQCPSVSVSQSVFQSNSVQDGIYAFGKAHMRPTPSLRSFHNVAFEIVPMLIWLTMALSRRFQNVPRAISVLTLGNKVIMYCIVRSSSAFPFPRLSPPGDRWCDVLGFVPAGSVPRSKPLVRVTLPASLSARSFLFTLACSGQHTHRSFQRWMSAIDTFKSGLPIPLFIFCSKLIESVRMMAYVVWLSPLEAIQRRVWMTALASIVKLEVETTVFMGGSRTLLDSEAPPWLVFGDRAISIHYEVYFCISTRWAMLIAHPQQAAEPTTETCQFAPSGKTVTLCASQFATGAVKVDRDRGCKSRLRQGL